MLIFCGEQLSIEHKSNKSDKVFSKVDFLDKKWYFQTLFYRENRAHMEGIFGDQLVALDGPVNYPPRSPDLTVMDIWIFAYIKGTSISFKESNNNFILKSCFRGTITSAIQFSGWIESWHYCCRGHCSQQSGDDNQCLQNPKGMSYHFNNDLQTLCKRVLDDKFLWKSQIYRK